MSERVGIPRRTLLAHAAVSVAALLAALLGLAIARLSGPGAGSGRAAAPSLPFAARSEISAAIRAEQASYAITSRPDGSLRATNQAQGLAASFTAGGLRLGSGAGAVSLSLESLSYGAGSQPLQQASVTASENRVAYHRGAGEEWYANRPSGIEQGFTVPAPAAGAPRGAFVALTLAVSARGAHLVRHGGAVQITGPGTDLLYGHLSARDASGRTLPAAIDVEGSRIVLRVAARAARFPLSIDPLLQNGRRPVLSEPSAAGMLGWSVALSGDGSTALVGAPRDSEQRGAVWVFVRSGGVWVQQGPKLVGEEADGTGRCAEPGEDEEETCAFGRSVALTEDGNEALIGAPLETAPCHASESCKNQGLVRLYVRNGSTWTSSETFTAGPEATFEARFGRSVAISADGATVLVGAAGDRSGRGAAYLFTHGESGWVRSARLTPADESGEGHFGASVAISRDGATALVGGPLDSADTGAAWVFRRAGETEWAQEGAKLVGVRPEPATEAEVREQEEEDLGRGHFGYSVSLSGDGETALIGAQADGRGSAYVFGHGEGGWQQTTRLAPHQRGAQSGFGYSVALSGDGNSALVGSPYENGGSVWLFTRAGGSWPQMGERLAGEGANRKGKFGFSVALEADGKRALVGAPSAESKNGAVWSFAEPGSLPAVTGVNPGSGPVAGGNAVTITGVRLVGVSKVEFEKNGHFEEAQFTLNPDGSITATAPRSPDGREGTAYVRVTTTAGTSPAEAQSAQYSYRNPASRSTGGESGAGGAGGALLALGAVPHPGIGVLSFSACRAALLSGRIAVAAHGRAAVRLLWRGSGTCSGRLTLRIRIKHGRHSQFTAVGSARFSLAPQHARTVTIRLSALGRSRLALAHGVLGGRLELLAALPPKSKARSANVKLIQKPARRR